MSYGWAAIFTVGAWLVGGFLDGLLDSGALSLNTLFAIIAMGCCIMKFIKDNNIQYSIINPYYIPCGQP